jgi:hypothetical protein
MAENVNILQAVISQWQGSSTLRAYPISSTRIPQSELQGPGGVSLPYVQVTTDTISHRYCSGPFRISWYRVTFDAFAASKATLDTIAAAIDSLFAMNIGLPMPSEDTCIVLAAIPDQERVGLDPGDYYGADVSTDSRTFRIQLNESTPAVRSALAT